MAQKPSSDTMEINSILEEARRNNSLSSSNRSSASSARNGGQPRRSSAPAYAQRWKDESGYVDINSRSSFDVEDQDEQDYNKPKKSKKPLVITIVVILVLVLVGGGGFTWYLYQKSGSSSVVSDNVYVNDVNIGGLTMKEAEDKLSSIEDQVADGIKVHVKAGDKDFNLTKKDFKYTFNTAEILDDIKEYSAEKSLNKGEKHFELSMKVDTAGTDALAKKLAQEVHAEPTDAKVTEFDTSADNMFTIADEITGKDIDAKVLASNIKNVFKNGKTSGDVNIEVKTVAPKRTKKYLQENIVKLSEFSTTSTNNDNGNENMRVSLNACDGSIIEPGETWSFNDCTGDSNDPDNGYKPAGVIVQGRSETGVGGGICQSSTTIYNAGILCGMEIKERACHYYKSTYVDAGRDATIDYGNIDLKMKNTFDYPLFMKCWMDGTELHCEMYGLQNSKFDEIKISTSDPDYFSTGYTVKAWRTYLLNGKEVDEDELPKSTYYTVAPSSGSDNDSNSSSSDDDDDDDDSSDSSSSSSSSSDDSDSSSSDNSASSSSAANNNNNAANNEASANEGDASSEQAQE